ncbi:MAG TPA: DNA primase [Atribacteraceae bacterium]|nr:DNA primase [Atribacteraceae bacterium]
MYIEDRYLEEIKNRVDLVSLISQYVELKPAGKGFRGLCPFHEENTPSFQVSPEKGIFHCFGCGLGGNLFNFIMKIENRSFPESVRYLAEKYGIDLPVGTKRNSKEQKEKERFFQFNEAVTKYYQWYLENSPAADARQARTYLMEKRGLSLDIIRMFGIGFSPSRGKESVKALLKEGFSGPELIQGGVGVIGQRRELLDRFRGRITFALHDVNGSPVGFAGRSLNETGPKYLNTADHPYFTKGHHLYGLFAAKHTIRKTGQVILVEGYMDFLALFQADFTNAIASMGTALTREQVSLLRRFSDEVLLCYDSDNAGKSATARGMGILKEKGLQVKILALPKPYDPDSLLRNKGKQAFADALGQAKSLFDYTLELLIDKYGCNTLEGKSKVTRELLPLIRSCENTVEKSLFIRQVAQKIDVPESLFYESLEAKKQPRANPSFTLESRKSYEPGNIKAERMLIKAAIENDSLRSLILTGLSPEEMVNRDHQRIYQAVSTLASIGSVSVSDLIDLFSGDLMICSTVTRLCSLDEGSSCKNAEMVRELIARVKRASLKTEIQRLREELSQSQDMFQLEVLRHLEQLVKQENALKNLKRGEGVL